MSELLQVENLSAGYGEAVVLQDVSFSLAEGETLALLGRNGTGKTTLMDTLAGATRQHGGSILLGVALQKPKEFNQAGNREQYRGRDRSRRRAAGSGWGSASAARSSSLPNALMVVPSAAVTEPERSRMRPRLSDPALTEMEPELVNSAPKEVKLGLVPRFL